MSLENTVTTAVAAVAPIFGVSFGSLTDKTTWVISFVATATAQQKTDAQNVINNFNLSVETARSVKQDALDALFDTSFDLARFIRAGAATNITANNVGSFLATITNNYRSLRAQIAAATTVAGLNAININSGWPSNP